MQITMKQAELEEAVRAYVSDMVKGSVAEISFSATRNGVETTIEVGQVKAPPAVATIVPQNEKAEPAAIDILMGNAEAAAEEKAVEGEAALAAGVPDTKKLFG